MMNIKTKKHREVTAAEKEERGNRIKYLRKILRYTSKVFGEKLNTKDSTLKSWEQGRHTGLTVEAALNIVELCKNEGVINCTLEWLLYGKGQQPEVRAGMFPGVVGNTISQELALFHQLHPNSMDVIINDDCMEPCFMKGDHVAGIRYFETHQFDRLVGLNCIVQLKNGEIVVRQLSKGDENNHYSLASINTKVPLSNYKNVELFSVAYIIWVRKPELVI